MNILICDDMREEADKLVKILRDCGGKFNVTAFYNAPAALLHIRSGAVVDCCFLDIVMPEMSGVALAEALRKDGFKGELVFLSTSREYGPESYAVKAFGYLLKPPTREAVRDVLSDIENTRLSGKRGGIFVKSSSVTKFILFSDISHVEVIGRYVYFRLINETEIESHATFAEIAPRLLIDARFGRCHRSFIINMDYIEAVAGNEITMRDGAKVPITRSYSAIKEELLRRILSDE